MYFGKYLSGGILGRLNNEFEDVDLVEEEDDGRP